MRENNGFKTAALHNLGCKVNAYETEAMEQQLREAGYVIVDFRQPADVYVINTCTVTNVADKKSRQMLHRARRQNPKAVVVAAGCFAQVSAEDLKRELTADIIIGNNQKGQLCRLLEEYERNDSQEKAQEEGLSGRRLSDHGIRRPGQALSDLSHSVEYEEMELSTVLEHTRAFIKIQDGCNQFCSYCIIPYARGRIRSRRPEQAVKEIRGLADQGYQEVVLTGIHLSSYGADFKGDDISLLSLLREIQEIPGIRRIRLGSLEPGIITEEFVRELAALDKVCPHFHLSLQSGCDATLKRMNRHYTTAEYEEKCQILRRFYTHPAITTDVITGFPGETEEEFARTKAFLEKIGFYEMHVFPYSVRKGTRAASMPDQVPEQVKKERSAQLLDLTRAMSEHFRMYYAGQEMEVLLEEEAELGGHVYMTGHTKEYIRCAFEKGEKNRVVAGEFIKILQNDVVFCR